LLDWRLRDIDGATFIEGSWQGRSDADPGCGRRWATLVDGELVGHIFIQCALSRWFDVQGDETPTFSGVPEACREAGHEIEHPRYH
jgi:hypothetical protein